MDKLTISVDFDNTIFTEKYPGLGTLIPGSRDTINWLYDMGHVIIINTCREGVHSEVAQAALNSNGIKWHYMNMNNPERVAFYNHDSRKIGCDISVDDRDIHVKSSTCVVDWAKTRKMFESILLPKKKIVCIVGCSGTGKTFLAEYLRKGYNIPMIESYTDRPKRTESEVGHTFLSTEEFDDLNMAEMIAFTCWSQGDGKIARYCCMQDDVDSEVQTYVIDERGLKYLRKYWSSQFIIFAVRMYSLKEERLQRISIERYNRDEGLFNMTSDDFDYFIENDYSDNMYNKYDSLYKRIKTL